MKASERVLDENNKFQPFPERIMNRAIETEQKAPLEETNEPDPNLPVKEEGKSKVASENKQQAKAQKEAAKKPKPNASIMLKEMPSGVEKDDVLLPRKDNAKKLAEAKTAKAIGDIVKE